MNRLKMLIVLGSAAAALAVGLGAHAGPAKPDFTLLAVLNAAGAQIDPS